MGDGLLYLDILTCILLLGKPVNSRAENQPEVNCSRSLRGMKNSKWDWMAFFKTMKFEARFKEVAPRYNSCRI